LVVLNVLDNAVKWVFAVFVSLVGFFARFFLFSCFLSLLAFCCFSLFLCVFLCCVFASFFFSLCFSFVFLFVCLFVCLFIYLVVVAVAVCGDVGGGGIFNMSRVELFIQGLQRWC